MLREHRRSIAVLVRRTSVALAGIVLFWLGGALEIYERYIRERVPEIARPTVEFLGGYLDVVLVVAVIVAFYLAFHETRLAEQEANAELAKGAAHPAERRTLLHLPGSTQPLEMVSVGVTGASHERMYVEALSAVSTTTGTTGTGGGSTSRDQGFDEPSETASTPDAPSVAAADLDS